MQRAYGRLTGAGLIFGATFALTLSGACAETPLERGEYLMNSIVACGNCHTPQDANGPIAGMNLAGGLVFDESPAFVAIAPNITPDAATGIGDWSDDELRTAIREGKRPDGSTIGPPMPFGFYRAMSDDDINAIIAYLHTLDPVENDTPPSEYSFPLPPAYGPPVTTVAAVDPSDTLAYGAYLAGPLGHCMECHSTPLPTGAPDVENALGHGGLQIHGPWGVSVAADITPTGIGHYSDAELAAIITTGVRPDGSHLLPPMGVSYYDNMTDADVAAIIAYLRTLPPS